MATKAQKNEAEKKRQAAEAAAANANAATDPATAPEPPAAPSARKEKLFVVKHGALVVGKGEIRVVGAKVKESELTTQERKFFTGDGTIAEVTAQKAE